MAKEVFQKAQDRTLSVFQEDAEKEWKAPFYFIQGADPQFGLMKAYAIGNCDSGGDEWDQELKITQQAVQAINHLNPKPKFFVICGDLVHGMPGTPWREAQTRDLKNVLEGLSCDIPAVFVSGNHDLGNAPTPETIRDYCQQWGDDYFAFWAGGVFFLVLNSQLYFDHSKCPEQKQAQDVWLSEQLAIAEKKACKHVVVFQHIPLFLKSPDEDHDYFNLEKSIRQELLDKFRKAERGGVVYAGESSVTMADRSSHQQDFCIVMGPPKAEMIFNLLFTSIIHEQLKRDLSGIKKVFSGHYHRNAGGSYKDLEMVVSSAIGCQLGEDTHGVRVVVVTAEKIVHRYYSLEKLSNEGIEKDLMDLIKQN